MAHIVVTNPAGETVLGPLYSSSPLTGKELVQRIQDSGALLDGRWLVGRCKLLLGAELLGEESILEGGQEDAPLEVTVVITEGFGLEQVPPLLAIRHTGVCPGTMSSCPYPPLPSYVGLWRHNPDPDNEHVFTQISAPNAPNPAGTMTIYWSLAKYNDNRPEAYRWCARGPTHSFYVLGGVAERYGASHEMDGLTFTWDPNKEEQHLAFQPDPFWSG